MPAASRVWMNLRERGAAPFSEDGETGGRVFAAVVPDLLRRVVENTGYASDILLHAFDERFANVLSSCRNLQPVFFTYLLGQFGPGFPWR